MKAILLEKTETDFDNYLDSSYSKIDVCGYEYPASMVLEDVDPTAYRVRFSDWVSENREWACSKCGFTYYNKNDADYCCLPVDGKDY